MHPWNLISQPGQPRIGPANCGGKRPAMPGDSTTPLGLFLEHDRWATRRLLRCCSDLSPAEFEQRFEIGPGSLHDTLIHITSAMHRWTDRISGSPLRASLEGTKHTVAQLIGLHDATAAAFRDLAQRLLADGAFNDSMTIELTGESSEVECYTFTRGTAIAHVLTHGTHHRAQCIWMLRRLRPQMQLPDFDAIESQIMPGED
jgi:uncharacterized damage-inducible protein DinB